MKAFITKVTPWFPKRVHLQWDLDEVTESGVFHFDVERSGSPGGPWTTIVANLADTYLYDDPLNQEEANVLSLARDIYYRIRVVPPSGALNAMYSVVTNLDGQAATEAVGPRPVMGFQVMDPAQFEVDPLTGESVQPHDKQPGRLRLLRRKILRDEYIRLRRLAGMEFWLLKRRHFGVRCTDCYDPATREVTRSRCLVCYGTSWTGGYFTPVAILGGSQHASQVQSDISPQTKDDVHTRRIELLDFPRVDEGDLLVEKAHNRRFLVRQRYYTSLKTVTVHQTVTASELERQAVEYAIPVTL
ncbi:MAG: hypothetical protein COZ56_16000 [Armatimonadetes bacterium CG_4_8_14_3_um_filter_58_9]|nr:MAG: hypothetical protein COZ56_16000 [Armatimonadetes bacterium CG_4_8_14_3_um_filter_58_9]